MEKVSFFSDKHINTFPYVKEAKVADVTDKRIELAGEPAKRVGASPYSGLEEMIDSADFGKVLYFGALRESETPTWSWNNGLFDRKSSGGTILDLSIQNKLVAI